jgi:hypothetical protein
MKKIFLFITFFYFFVFPCYAEICPDPDKFSRVEINYDEFDTSASGPEPSGWRYFGGRYYPSFTYKFNNVVKASDGRVTCGYVMVKLPKSSPYIITSIDTYAEPKLTGKLPSPWYKTTPSPLIECVANREACTFFQ